MRRASEKSLANTLYQHLQMRYLLLFFCAIFFSLKSYSGSSPEVVTASLINNDSLYYFMQVLTSDSLQGRETGQPGQKKAARFIADQFLRFGLTPATPTGFQEHPLSSRANEGKNLVIGETKLVYRKDFFVLESEIDTLYHFDSLYCTTLNAEIEHAADDHSLKPIQRNRLTAMPIVFIPSMTIAEAFDVFTTTNRRFYESVYNSLEGLPLLFIVDDLDSLQQFLLQEKNKKSPLYISISQREKPVYWISIKAAEAIFPSYSKLSARKKKSLIGNFVKTEIQLPVFSDAKQLIGENVPFVLRGISKPDELVALTAHYDHLGLHNDTVFYGADDDASGTACVLELARVFSLAAENGNKPFRSILFMPVSGEEKGLLGSRYYSQHPLFPLKNTIANVNIDMIGRVDPEHDSAGVRNYIYVIGADKLSTELHDINEAANTDHIQMVLDYRYNVPGEPNRFYFRSDHYNFAKNGVPAIFYFNGKHDDYHKSTDTLEKIDFEAMGLRTRLIFHTVWELANRPQRIVVNRKNNME